MRWGQLAVSYGGRCDLPHLGHITQPASDDEADASWKGPFRLAGVNTAARKGVVFGEAERDRSGLAIKNGGGRNFQKRVDLSLTIATKHAEKRNAHENETDRFWNGD